MSPKTTLAGVADAVDILKEYILSLNFETRQGSQDVINSVLSVDAALDGCALSEDMRIQVASVVAAASNLSQTGAALLNVQRARLQAETRSLEIALEKERVFREHVKFCFVVALYLLILVVFLVSLKLYVLFGVVPVAFLQNVLLKDGAALKALVDVLSSHSKNKP